MPSIRQYGPQAPRFSRLWWLEGVKTFIFVAIITVLVWVFADLEFTDEIQLSATIRLKSTLQSLAVLSPREVPVEFTLKGDRRSLDEFSRQLNARNQTIEYDVAQDYGPQDRKGQIRVSDIIRSAGGAQKAGLTVSLSFDSDNTIDVELDRRIRQEVAVEFAYRGATLVAKPKIVPATVSVYVARTKWAELLERLGPSAKPTIKTAQRDLADQTDREPVTINIEIVALIDGFEVEPETTNVKVTYQIDQPTKSQTLKVSVRIVAPSQWYDDDTWLTYRLVRKSPLEWRKDIKVVGTRKDITELVSRSAEIDAYIVLRPEDKKEGAWWQAPVTVRFPPDLQSKVTLVEDKLTVEYKLQRRQPAPEQP